MRTFGHLMRMLQKELEDPAGIRAPVQAGILYYIDSAVRTVILRDHAAERIWLYYH